MFELDKLNYSYDGLEPVIDKETVEIHYTKHHQNYLNGVNAALEKYNHGEDLTLEEIANDLTFLNEEDKVSFMFNLGGVLNHNLYWKILSNKQNNLPVGKIKEMIDEKYENFDNFKNEFIKVASTLTGSGWAFLVLDKNNNLDIVITEKQYNPLFDGLTPIIGLDLWEHAYYLKYQNRRPEYINNFFDILDFEEINKLV